MKFTARSRTQTALPGVVGPARADRRLRAVLTRVRPGDVVVIDQIDLDRASAQALLDAGAVAVVNASASISGRFPNKGPEVLAAAGVPLVDVLGADLFGVVREGDSVRVDGSTVQAGAKDPLEGRLLDTAVVAELMTQAQAGLSHQLNSFTHNSSEFLRREQDLLLHGQGVPTLATRIADRPVVVVVPGRDLDAQLKKVRRFVAEQRPVVIAVDSAADLLRERGTTPDVIVLQASEAETVSTKTLRAAKDVVVTVDRGAPRSVSERFTQMGIQPRACESSATTEDVALLLADSADASVIVGVGMHATLSDFLDRQRAGLASTYLTRLKVGPRLVDATAVATVYSGRVRPRHLVALVAAGALALGAAISTTPVGQDWADDLSNRTSSVIDTIQGKFS